MASTPQSKRAEAQEFEVRELFALGVAVTFVCVFVWRDLNWLLAIAGGIAAGVGYGALLSRAATHGLATALAVTLWAAGVGLFVYEQSDGSIVLAAAAAAVVASGRLAVHREAYSSEAAKSAER
jgi:hypothetical protein